MQNIKEDTNMKKILVSLAVICMLSLFAVTAFAANALVSGFDAEDIAAYMNLQHRAFHVQCGGADC